MLAGQHTEHGAGPGCSAGRAGEATGLSRIRTSQTQTARLVL